MSVKADEEMLAGYADRDACYPCYQTLMLLNLNAGYTDNDADLCIKMMSLCCIIIFDTF